VIAWRKTAAFAFGADLIDTHKFREYFIAGYGSTFSRLRNKQRGPNSKTEQEVADLLFAYPVRPHIQTFSSRSSVILIASPLEGQETFRRGKYETHS